MSQKKRPEFETVISVRPTVEMLAKIHSIVEECVNKELEKILQKLVDKKLEDVVRKCLEEKERAVETEIVKLRKVPMEEAVMQIKTYIDKHQGCRTSDIIYDLALDPDLVLKALKKLEKDKLVRGENIES